MCLCPPPAFVELLLAWPGSLVSRRLRNPEGIAKLWRESLELVELVGNCGTLADLGSGAGFPGVPLKMALPEARIYLIERNQRKAAFLREIKRRLGLWGLFVFRGSWDGVDLRVECAISRASGLPGPGALSHILAPGGLHIVYLGQREPPAGYRLLVTAGGLRLGAARLEELTGFPGPPAGRRDP